MTRSADRCRARTAALALAGAVTLIGLMARAERPAADFLPFRLLYGNPGPTATDETACYVWSEGGRLHVRITSDGAEHEVEGSLEVNPGGILKDVSLRLGEVRIRQPVPSLFQFDLTTRVAAEEFSIVMAGDIDNLRADLRIDGRTRPDAMRIGERQERPKGLPAELVLSGARAGWIERFGFD